MALQYYTLYETVEEHTDQELTEAKDSLHKYNYSICLRKIPDLENPLILH